MEFLLKVKGKDIRPQLSIVDYVKFIKRDWVLQWYFTLDLSVSDKIYFVFSLLDPYVSLN